MFKRKGKWANRISRPSQFHHEGSNNEFPLSALSLWLTRLLSPIRQKKIDHTELIKDYAVHTVWFVRDS